MAIALMLVACSEVDAAPGSGRFILTKSQVMKIAEEAKASGSTEQANALSDGDVTSEEYLAAFQSLRDCVESRGYVVEGPETSPLTGSTIEFAYEAGGLDMTKALQHYEDCEAEHWSYIGGVYSSTVAQKTEPTLLAEIVSCLEIEGIAADPDAQLYVDLVSTDDSEATSALIKCAQERTWRLYPDLPALSINF